MRKQIPLSRETPLSEVIVAKDAEQSDSQTSVNVVLTKTTMVMLTLTLACMTLVLGVMTVSLLHAYSKGYGTATAAYDALLPAMQHMNHTRLPTLTMRPRTHVWFHSRRFTLPQTDCQRPTDCS
jgi:hypothetical protein